MARHSFVIERDDEVMSGFADYLFARLKHAEARVAELEKKLWLYVLYVDRKNGGIGLTDEQIQTVIDQPLPEGTLAETGLIEEAREREED